MTDETFLFVFRAVAAEPPAQMVVDVNFEALTYDYDAGELTINITTPPASAETIVNYDVVFSGNSGTYTIQVPADASFPVIAEFSGNVVAAAAFFIQNFKGPLWEVGYTIAARTANNLLGVASASADLTIKDHTVADELWSAVEEHDFVVAGGVDGRVRLTTDAGISVAANVDLRYYLGAAPVVPNNFATIFQPEVSPLIAPDAEVLSTASVAAIGEPFYAALLGRIASYNHWFVISENTVSAIIEGLIDPEKPAVTVMPVVTGDGTINVEMSVTDGTWTGSPTIARHWMDGDAEIPAAVNSTFIPLDAIDLGQLRVRVRATNAAGTTEVFTTPTITVHYAAPANDGDIPDQLLDQEAGSSITVQGADYFTGDGLSFSMTTHAAASINAATGEISLNKNAAVSDVNLTVSAANSGGIATNTFLFRVTAGAPGTTWPADPDISLSFSEVVDPTEIANAGYPGESWHMKRTVTGAGPFTATTASGNFEHRAGSFGETSLVGIGVTAPVTDAISTGTALARVGKSTGDTITHSAGWYCVSGAAAGQQKILWTGTPIVLQGLNLEVPTGVMPMLSQTKLNLALAKADGYYPANLSAGASPTITSGDFPAAIVLAAFQGNTTADAKTLSFLRKCLTAGNNPWCAGGYPMQHEVKFAMAAAFAKLTSRIWSQLTAAEKSKIDLLMRAESVAAAYTSNATSNFIAAGTRPGRSLRGIEAYWYSEATNFTTAMPAMMICCRAYFGSAAAVTDYLNTGYVKSTLAASLQAQGLDNAYFSHQIDGPAGFYARPTTAQVEAGVKNWAWYWGGTLATPQTLWVNMVSRTFLRNIESGYGGNASNGWIGPGINGRGKIIANAAGLPNKGALGMIFGLDASDGEGPRISTSYATWDMRNAVDIIPLMVLTGQLDRNDSAVQAAFAKVNIGLTDLQYKSTNGFYSYAHGGGGGSEDWTTASHGTTWGWTENYGMFFDVIQPYMLG